jgi:hypothetical protein
MNNEMETILRMEFEIKTMIGIELEVVVGYE